MRTTIVIDDELINAVLEETGVSTKREAVDLGLRVLLRLKRQERARELRGKLAWEGDFERMRLER